MVDIGLSHDNNNVSRYISEWGEGGGTKSLSIFPNIQVYLQTDFKPITNNVIIAWKRQ